LVAKLKKLEASIQLRREDLTNLREVGMPEIFHILGLEMPKNKYPLNVPKP